MRRTLCVTTACLLASACAPGGRVAPKPEVGVVTVGVVQEVTEMGAEGSMQAFVPAVAATEEGGECEILRVPGQFALHLLSFPSREASVRNVSIRFDSAANPVHYSDARGDLRRERTGPRTSVTLDFQTGVAHGFNWVPGRPAERAVGTLTDALAAPHLGNPQRMIDLVRSRCMKP